ncbi:hypothetical protein BH18ACT6_BH18ACT6_06170 [soil metagenome]
MGQLQSAIDGLRTEPVDEFTNLELADSLVELEGSISRLEAERCRRLSVFVERKTHRELEFSSPSAFLIDRAKITPARASRLVAQAPLGDGEDRPELAGRRLGDRSGPPAHGRPDRRPGHVCGQ